MTSESAGSRRLLSAACGAECRAHSNITEQERLTAGSPAASVRLAQSTTVLIYRPLSHLACAWLDGPLSSCSSLRFAPRGRNCHFHHDGSSHRSRPTRTLAGPPKTGRWRERRHPVTRAKTFSSTRPPLTGSNNWTGISRMRWQLINIKHRSETGQMFHEPRRTKAAQARMIFKGVERVVRLLDFPDPTIDEASLPSGHGRKCTATSRATRPARRPPSRPVPPAAP